jgi:hypothetical protein
MTRGDDDLVARLAEHLRAGASDARPREDCPAPERIWAAVRLELPPDERLAILDHTVECPACAESWRLAAEMQRDEPRGEDTGAGAAPSRRHVIFRRVAAIAALVVIGFGALWVSRRPASEPVSREPSSVTTASQTAESQPRDDFWLRWTAGPAGSTYDVLVTTSDLTPIAEAHSLTAPEYRVPAERLGPVTPGASVLWRVVVHAPDGSSRASATFESRVR